MLRFFFIRPTLTVASIPIPGGRSLRPVENRERSFDKVVDQNSPPPVFFIPPYFSLGKLHP